MKDDSYDTYYDILEIAETASSEEIKKAYRRLCKEYHPDGLPPEREGIRKYSEEKIKQIIEAYDVLSHSEKRLKYDQQLKTHRAEQQPNPENPPKLEVDKTSFIFSNIQVGTSFYDSFKINNTGGGLLSGQITTNKRWLKVSQESIDTAVQQAISFEIDTSGLSFDFSDTGLIEIHSNGGDIGISVSLATESLAVKPPDSLKNESTGSDNTGAKWFGLIVIIIIVIVVGGLWQSKGSGRREVPEEQSRAINQAPHREAKKVTPMSLQAGRYRQVGSVHYEYFQEKVLISVPYVDIKDDSLIVHLEFKNESNIASKYLIGNGVRDNSRTQEQSFGLPEIEDQYGNKYAVQLPSVRGEIVKYSFEAEPFAWGGKLTNKYSIPVGASCGAYMVFPKPRDTNSAKLHLPGVNGWIYSSTIDLQLTNRSPIEDGPTKEEQSPPSTYHPEQNQTSSPQEQAPTLPVQAVASIRVIRVSTGQILPSGTRLQVLLYDKNGNNQREAKFIRANQNNFQLEIELAEPISAETRYRVNWYLPQAVQQQIYRPQPPQGYIPLWNSKQRR